MHNIRTSQNSQKRNLLSTPTNTPRFRRPPFSEQDILCLQDKFLESGIHHIKVKNVATGRELVETFLSSLNNYYENVACLTAKAPTQNLPVCDVYRELKERGTSRKAIEDFFIDNFYFDFLWIEASRDLVSKSWFPAFEQMLNTFKIDRTVPVVVITYG